MKRRVLPLLVAALAVAGLARAEESIQDNSFLIEEAYNQGAGVVQHIGTFMRLRGSGDWSFAFTQEWPVPNVRHQLSYTVPVGALHDGGPVARGVGDVAIHYRYQLVGDAEAQVALSPRASVLLPTGDDARGLGTGGVGAQVNVPASVVLSSRVVSHFNLGATWVSSARNPSGDRADLTTYTIGQSIVGLVTPRFNVLAELVFSSGQTVSGPGTRDRVETLFLNPGIRWAHNLRNDLQIVPGIAVPIGLGPSSGSRAVFFYLSVEHPFR